MYSFIDLSSQISIRRESLVPQITGLIHQFGLWLVCDLKIRLLLLLSSVRTENLLKKIVHKPLNTPIICMLNFVKLTNFAISLRTISQTSFLIMDLYSTTMESHHPCFVFNCLLKSRRLGLKVWRHQCNIILNFLGGWLTWNVDLGRPTCSFASWKALEIHFGFLDKLEGGRECPLADFKLL